MVQFLDKTKKEASRTRALLIQRFTDGGRASEGQLGRHHVQTHQAAVKHNTNTLVHTSVRSASPMPSLDQQRHRLTLRTVLLSQSSLPMSGVLLVEANTTLKTPSGTPASCARTARARAESGVSAAGLHTILHPAASAYGNSSVVTDMPVLLHQPIAIACGTLTRSFAHIPRTGPTLRVIIAAGKFHGVMAAATPTGCCIVMRRRPGMLCGMTDP